MIRNSVIALYAIVLLLVPLFSAQGGVVTPPNQSVAGLSQSALSSKWWQWAVSFPDGANPVQDTTGAFSHLGDQGDYFFLAGAFTQDPVKRTVKVKAGQPLCFPLTNVISVIPFFGNTEAEIRADAAHDVGVVSNLSVKLDGVELLPAPGTALADYRQQSPPGFFDLVLEANNVFGLDPQTLPAVSDGYWASLSGLEPGSYTLSFTSTSEGTGAYEGDVFSQDITYNVTVVPLPGAVWAALAIVPFIVIGHRRLKASSC